MSIVAHVKGLAAEIFQNEEGEISLHMVTGQLPPHEEEKLQAVLERAADAVRIVLALERVL